MKNNKIILAVLILFMIVMIALIFSSCGGVNPVIPSPEPEPDLIPEIELEEEKSEEIIFDEDFSITLEDGVRIEIKANTINKNALLYVSKIAINKNKSSSNVTLLSLYDIDIFGDNITLSGTVTLKLPVPAGMTEDEVIIGHFHQGSTDILMGNLILGKYVVEVSEFSEFGVFSKNSPNTEVSSDDLNSAASGYVTSQSSISWAPPEKPEFKTKSNTWFDSDEEYDIEWTDSFWTPMIKYEIEEYLNAFDENKDPYTSYVTVSDHHTYDNQFADDDTFFYRVKAHNTWTNKSSEWTESLKINVANCPPPNLSISTHEVNAGEKYTLTWNTQSIVTKWEIWERFEDENGNITNKPNIEVPNKIDTALAHFGQLNNYYGTIIYVIEFYAESWQLSIKRDVPGTYYYSIRSDNGCESQWYPDPPESGDFYVEVLPDPETAKKDAEIVDISVFTEDDPLKLNKWYDVWVEVENTGDVTQNFKISGFGSYSTDFDKEDVFLELTPDDWANAIFQCKFTGTLIDSRQLHFTVYDEYANELDTYWEEFNFVSETLDAPTGVSASNGTYTDKVYISWNTVSGASYYKLYRAASETGTKTAITNWVTSHTYYDYDVTPGTHYFYFVKAASSNSGADESPYSASDEGWAYLDTTLSAPTGVSASNGTYTDKVYISWNTVSGASYYKLYRAASETGTKTAITNWVTSHTYYDYDVTPGTHYFYFVKAASSNSGADESPYSASDEGWAYLDTTLSAPTGVTASDGTYTNRVYTSWNSVTGASYYKLYRAATETGTKTAITGWQTTRYYSDYDVTPGTHYFYFVKAASNNSGADESPYSDYDEGYPGGDTPEVPTLYDPGSSVSSGEPYTVSWSDESSSGATSYRLVEATNPDFSPYTEIYYVGGTSKTFSYNVGNDTTYYYKVCSHGEPSNFSAWSEKQDIIVKGEASLSAPTGVDASDGSYNYMVRITWNSVSGASHYRVYRSESSGGIKTPISSWQTNTSFDYGDVDTSTYYYWVKAATSSSGDNESPYSDYDEGHRSERNYGIAIFATPSGYGTTSPPPGIYSAEEGSTYIIIALPSSGHTFDYWSGDIDGSSTAISTYVIMDDEKVVTAHFK